MSQLGFDIGVSALLTARSRLETIGHNLANATTPGYSRQDVLVSSARPQSISGLLQGGGVQAESIRRSIDAVLNGRLSQHVSALGRLDTNTTALTQIESLLGGSSDTGPVKLLEKMLASFSSLASAADDRVLRSTAVQSASAATGRFNQLADDLQTMSQTVASQLESTTRAINSLATRVATLNRQIVDSEASGSASNDLRDQREQAVRDLAVYADVRAIEHESGYMRVLIDGRTLVSPQSTQELRAVQTAADGSVRLQLGGEDIEVDGGQLGGLVSMAHGYLPQLRAEIDSFARNLIYETNRAHSTGVALGGPFQALQTSYALTDQDGDGRIDDERLSNAGLPFEVVDGELSINVTDRATGDITTHRIAIDTRRTTVGDLVSALDGLPHVAAQLDSRGFLRVQADTGFGFDFAARLEGSPDALGSFGGGRASLGTATSGPFALAAGDTLDFSGPSGNFSLAFQTTGFANIGAATADEIAGVLNADASFAANGLIANSVGGALVVQTAAGGATQTFTVQGGTAASALGWSAGQVVTGSDVAATPTITGAYTGNSNGAFVFRPNMDGTIGSTPGLVVEVFDATGHKLTDLQVGAGYQPGDELEVADGVRVAFDFGHLSATDGDVFRVEVTGDSDTARLLPALGLNGFFDGLDASSITVQARIVSNPDQLAASLSGASGDADNLLRLIDAAGGRLDSLGGDALDERLARVVGDVGFELQAANDARDAEQISLDSLESRREQISGVNTDEELVQLIEQQQAFGAAAQFLRVISEVSAELLEIV